LARNEQKTGQKARRTTNEQGKIILAPVQHELRGNKSIT